MRLKEIKKELLDSGKYYDIQKAKYNCWKDNKDTFFINKFNQNKINFKDHIETNKDGSIKLAWLLYSKPVYQQYKKVNKYIDISWEEYQAYELLRKSRSKQRQEIKDQLAFWVLMDYEIIFNTYTFNQTSYNYFNEDIDKMQTSLTRILAKYTDDYIGNIDYGKQNDRIHFHVLEAYKKDGLHKIKEEIVRTNIINELDIAYPTENKEHILDLTKIDVKDKWTKKVLNIITSSSITWNLKYGFTYPELIEYNSKSYARLPCYLAKLTNHTLKVKNKRLFKKRLKKGTLNGSQYKRYKWYLDKTNTKSTEATLMQYVNVLKAVENRPKSTVLEEQKYEMLDILANL